VEHMGQGQARAYATRYYSLDAVIAVGYRVNSRRAARLRRVPPLHRRHALRQRVGPVRQREGRVVQAQPWSHLQTFDGKEVYPTVEEKAANLLYFVVKNHAFTDGNRGASALAHPPPEATRPSRVAPESVRRPASPCRSTPCQARSSFFR
jgi:hypothetical protein